MWWEPQTEEEQVTLNAVLRLNDYFLTPSRVIEYVWGVGSTLDSRGHPVPLLILDESMAMTEEDPKSRVASRFGFNIWNQQRSLFVPISEAGPIAQEILQGWEVPNDTVLFFSAPPLPTFPVPGMRVYEDAGRDATTGFILDVGGEPMLTTAGHLVDTMPCSITAVEQLWWGGRRRQRLGDVVFYADPTQDPGADVAVVRLFDNRPAPRRSRAKLAHAPSVPDLGGVTLFGGRSRRRGWVNGALQSTRSLDGRIWKNCWSIAEVSGGFATQGDSGGPVFLDGDSVMLGHLVAAFGIQKRSGRYQCGLVQDIHTVVEEVRKNLGPLVTVIDGGLARPKR